MIRDDGHALVAERRCMHLYMGTATGFLADASGGTLVSKLAGRFFDEFRFHPPDNEVRAWANSLAAVGEVIDSRAFRTQGVLVEYQLPLTSRRLDCMFTGHDTSGTRSAVIVELKQWDRVEPSWIDGCVTTFVGSADRDVLHPSAQAGGYQRYLIDTNTAFVHETIRLDACAFLHNLPTSRSTELVSPRFAALIRENPLFVGDDADDLGAYLEARVGDGEGERILESVVRGRFRPSKRLLDHTASVIRNEPAYVLLDEQEVAYKAVLTQVSERAATDEPTVFLIRGGPGTGKSLIALNLLASLSELGYATLHATGSRAFTENLRKVVGRRAASQFKYFNSLSDAEAGVIDVLIADEAHRIREFSWNWRTPKVKRTDIHQVTELMRAARTSVFFIDDQQVVRPREVGHSELIRGAAADLDLSVFEFELEAQFRCGGSESFVSWVDNTLEIGRTQSVIWDDDEDFELRIVDSPFELESWVRAKSKSGFTSRLSAGFCWPWSTPEPDGTLVDDVVIDDWAMPWNARPEAARLAPGIPKSSYWASDPGGLEQVGCIYTAQGFEYDYAGVIFGRDLVYRPGEGWIGRPEYSHDGVVTRETRGIAEFTSLAKNAYRVLLTRGLKGCAVFFQDRETRDFVLSRMDRHSAGIAPPEST
jgi:DUF2075 family protein